MSNYTNQDTRLLTEVCLSILYKHGLTLYSEFANIECHYFYVDTDDIDKVVNMNFELADSVAMTPELDNCKQIAMFKTKDMA